MLGIQEKIGLWAYEKNRDINSFSYSIRRNWILRKLDPLVCSFLELLMPRCWDKNCNKHGEPCLLRGYGEGDEDAIYWYCAEHSQRHGFCFGCGEFWGGTESFDFGPGYCSNCASEFEDDYDENWIDDWSYEEA